MRVPCDIYELVKTAFATAKVSEGDEQDFVEPLRRGGGYIPDLALVMEDRGRLSGENSAGCDMRPP